MGFYKEASKRFKVSKKALSIISSLKIKFKWHADIFT